MTNEINQELGELKVICEVENRDLLLMFYCLDFYLLYEGVEVALLNNKLGLYVGRNKNHYYLLKFVSHGFHACS